MGKSFTVREWLDKLRHGNLKQAKGVLRTSDDELCCLGVACMEGEVAWEENFAYENVDSWDDDQFYIMVEAYKAKSNLGDYQVGMPKGLLEFPEGIEARLTDLTEMNDSGKTFAEIADYIEETFPHELDLPIRNIQFD